MSETSPEFRADCRQTLVDRSEILELRTAIGLINHWSRSQDITHRTKTEMEVRHSLEWISKKCDEIVPIIDRLNNQDPADRQLVNGVTISRFALLAIEQEIWSAEYSSRNERPVPCHIALQNASRHLRDLHPVAGVIRRESFLYRHWRWWRNFIRERRDRGPRAS